MSMSIFDVLAEPLRRQILDLLREDSRMVGDLVDLLGITQPNVSKHLRILRDANLVRVRRDAQWRRYELNPAPLAELDDWLEPYRQKMEARYERLDNLLEQLKDEAEDDGNEEIDDYR